MPITSRAAVSLADLRAATAVLTRAWRAGAPHVDATPGDLSWWYAQAWPADLSERLQLWSSAGRVVGWSWGDAVELEFGIWSGEPRLDARVQAAVLAAAIRRAGDRAAAGGDGALEAWAADDDPASIERLLAAGFRLAPVQATGHAAISQFQQTVTDIERRPRPGLAAGYRIRSLAGRTELAARVEVHRAAFAPSRMSVAKYERLIALPDYRFEDDLVVEAPDGSFAAFTMAWWDPVARVGEFEPVGTHPDHRRRGLAAALLDEALRRYARLGAGLVQVLSDTRNAGSEALYPSVGFRRRTILRRYRRAADPVSA